jgi:hypothetical protein
MAARRCLPPPRLLGAVCPFIYLRAGSPTPLDPFIHGLALSPFHFHTASMDVSPQWFMHRRSEGTRQRGSGLRWMMT